MDNPFERYDLDPRQGIAAITARLKELAEDAVDEAERDAIRAAWEELTLDPRRRLDAALFAHPETREPIGLPPTAPRKRDHGATPFAPRFRDLAARPSLLLAVDPSGSGVADGELDSFAEDPVLAEPR